MQENEISYIVDRVIERLNPIRETAAMGISYAASYNKQVNQSGGFDSIDEAVSSAGCAQKELLSLSLAKRKEIIAKIREACRKVVPTLAEAAVDETGFGRVQDKIKKNNLVIDKTPGVEDIEPVIFTGDHGLTLIERAPYGVIGAITPSTNPTETIICNTIGMIAAGNSVVFNPHPYTKAVCAYVVDIINRAVVENGGPPNLISIMREPTIESAQQLMKHKDIRLLVVTGGSDVVRVAMQSEKRVIAAGPGNPPVVVDETADLDRAGHDIVWGASLDNNIVCIAEKEVICVESAVEGLLLAMKKHHAMELSSYQLRQLEKVILKEGSPNKAFIGKNANVILKEIGISAGDDLRVIVVRTEADHPFVLRELMMPVIPIVTVRNVDEAIDLAKKVEHGYGHTAVMHSKNIDNLHKMARTIGTAIFVKNGPSYAGLGYKGEGYTSFTIASPTGEGMTSAKNFTKERRCVLKDRFRII